MTERPYHQLVREERQFCALLWHLLLSDRENLAAFLALLVNRSGGEIRMPDLDGSEELYLEYSWLRDEWRALGQNNKEKRQRVEKLVELTGAMSAAELPRGISELNERSEGPVERTSALSAGCASDGPPQPAAMAAMAATAAVNAASRATPGQNGGEGWGPRAMQFHTPHARNRSRPTSTGRGRSGVDSYAALGTDGCLNLGGRV